MHHDGEDENVEDDSSDDEEATSVTKTMVNSARQGEKTWSNVVIDCLLIHQEHMLLHCRRGGASTCAVVCLLNAAEKIQLLCRLNVLY